MARVPVGGLSSAPSDPGTQGQPPDESTSGVGGHETPAGANPADGSGRPAAAPAAAAAAAAAGPPPPLAQQASICELMGFHRNQDLAWVPECMDAYMRTAIERAVAPPLAAPAPGGGGASGRSSSSSSSSSSSPPIVALGTEEEAKGVGARAARWVVQVGLALAADPLAAAAAGPSAAPPGGPAAAGAAAAAAAVAAAGAAAAAAAAAGACPVIVLRDAAPTALGAPLMGALARGPWRSYGLQLSELAAAGGATIDGADAGDPATAGSARLQTLPGIPPVPLVALVCSTTLFWKPAEPAEGAPIRRRAAPRAPELAGRVEAALFSRALATALRDLRARLPPGYLQSQAQARVAACLPPIAASIAAVVRNAVNPQLLPYACTILGCQPADLQARLLAAATAAADAALEPPPPQPRATAGGGARRRGRAAAGPEAGGGGGGGGGDEEGDPGGDGAGTQPPEGGGTQPPPKDGGTQPPGDGDGTQPPEGSMAEDAWHGSGGFSSDGGGRGADGSPPGRVKRARRGASGAGGAAAAVGWGERGVEDGDDWLEAPAAGEREGDAAPGGQPWQGCEAGAGFDGGDGDIDAALLF